jgi:hypothetical protein
MASHCAGSWPKISAAPSAGSRPTRRTAASWRSRFTPKGGEVFVEEGSAEIAAVTADDEGVLLGSDTGPGPKCDRAVGGLVVWVRDWDHCEFVDPGEVSGVAGVEGEVVGDGDGGDHGVVGAGSRFASCLA